MSDELRRSGLALLMLLGGLALGYTARKTRLVPERWGKTLHLVNIIALQANVAWITMWGVTWEWNLIRLPVAGLILSMAATLLGLQLGRLHRFEGRDRATFALACGMSNLGTTGGLLVIRVLLNDQALRFGNVYLLYWSFFTFLFCFPLAKHYSSGTRTSFGRLVASSVGDVRTLPLVGLLVGLGLAAWGPPRPTVTEDIVLILVMVSGFAAMFAIGVTLHLRMVRHYIPAYFTQGGVKFLLSPLAAVALVALLRLQGLHAQVVLIDASMSQAFYSVMIANIFGLNVHLANSMFLINTLTFLLVVFPLLSLLLPG